MTYAEKLKDPRWQKKRLEILQRDSFTCQLCSDTTTELHIHHKEYDFGLEPWEYEDSVLVALCKHCHHIEGKPGERDIKNLRIEKLRINDRLLIIFVLSYSHTHDKDYISLIEYSDFTDTYDFKTIVTKDDLDILNRLADYSKQLRNG